MPERVLPAITLTTPLADIRAIRPERVEALAMLGVRTAADLVKHLPMRYERLEAEAPIAGAKADQFITARGEIISTRVAGFGRRQRFSAVLVDHSGRLDLVWFNAPYMKQKLFPGLSVRVQGKTRRQGPGLQLANPHWELIRDNAPIASGPAPKEARVRPVYPASEHITSAQIEQAVGAVLEPAVRGIEEHLPEALRRQRHMPPLADAYRMAHAPETMEEAEEARRRLAYDELLLLQLGVFMRRAHLRSSTRAIPLRLTERIDKRIRARLPFVLTGAQERVAAEIAADLGKAEAANRLIQGDVGSGKTVVALYAMLLAVASKHQAALMAPTELLAEQHLASITDLLKGSRVKVELLTGTLPQREREGILRRLYAGDVDILVGTHALLTERVRFASLAVVVIDEQHRFGVHQRAVLREKGERDHGIVGSRDRGKAAKHEPADLPIAPHTLVMTATPIPRTLALTLMGDLDISTIDELPPGRGAIATRLVAPALAGDVYQYVRKRVDAGEQAYIVVPAIDTGASAAGAAPRTEAVLGGTDGGTGEAPRTETVLGGTWDLNDLRSLHARLEKGELAGKRLAAMHGRLKRDTREAIMARFRAGQIDALIATTVIEVGVDVPNATVMVVEHAERFGLAQLHQLRGRIGRGRKKSVCILIADAVTPDASARLAAIAASTDGFALAEKDLEIRGPGEVFGPRQAGAAPFRVADPQRDRDLLALARRDAQAWIEQSPELRSQGEELIRRRLLRAHGEWLGLGDVG